MKNRKKILVVGSSNTDMVVKSRHLPRPGETVLGGDFLMNPGGKGANQAVAAAKLGGDVTFMAKVGEDVFGKEAKAGLEQYGINTSAILVDENNPSGVALIMVNDQGENSISVALGANGHLTPEDILQLGSFIASADFILIQLEIPLLTVEKVVALSAELGKKVILNPAPAQQLSEALLSSIYLITPNESEATHLTNIEVTDEKSARQAAEVLRRIGVLSVIITLGEKGAYVFSDEVEELIPAPKAHAVDTTAAGDTFNGALAVALSEEKSLKEAVEFANKAAAFSVTRLGAQSSCPTLADLMQQQ